jgi:hypothetical protein
VSRVLAGSHLCDCTHCVLCQVSTALSYYNRIYRADDAISTRTFYESNAWRTHHSA